MQTLAAQLQASGLLDRNDNGQGEYGFFAELAGGQPLRGTAKRLQPPVLSRAFATLVEGRVERSGYAYGRVAENIAGGQETAGDVVVSWMQSAGHRRNLLNAELVDAGIGFLDAPDDRGRVRHRRYWVAIFGRRSR